MSAGLIMPPCVLSCKPPHICKVLVSFTVSFHPLVWCGGASGVCPCCCPSSVTLPPFSELTHSLGDCPCAAGRFPAWQPTCRAGLWSGPGLQLVSVTPSTVPKAVFSRRLPCCQITGGLCLGNPASVGPPRLH